MAKKQKSTATGVSSFVINRRLLFLFASVLVLFTILVLRLGQIQIVKADEYASQAMELQTREFSVSSDRGLIYDANGKTVAVNQAGYTLWATPADIAEQEKEQSGYTRDLAEKLAGILTEAELSEDDIYEKLTSESKTVKLVKYVDEVTYRDIEALMEEDFPVGLVSSETTRRYYPMGEFASHIIGLTNDDNTGTFGIELYYDQYLNGSEGKLITSNNGGTARVKVGSFSINGGAEKDVYVLINKKTGVAAQGLVDENGTLLVNATLYDATNGYGYVTNNKGVLKTGNVKATFNTAEGVQTITIPADAVSGKFLYKAAE